MEKSLYKTYRSYIKKRFGEAVLKVSLNGGFSCPNRDGKISIGGCSFCENRAFSRAHDNIEPVETQLNSQILKSSHKFNKFIAYLQPFTNTYGSVSQLQSLYEPLIKMDKVVGLAIGTRPDCLDDEVCDYLEDVSKRTYLSVEVGLQSASDKVLKAINRGHNFKQFEDAVLRLNSRKIETVAHIMIGLPEENDNDIIYTAKQMARLPVQGVKVHQLMVVEDTAIEKLYKLGKLNTLSLEDYACKVGNFITYLREDQFLHRIMADSTRNNGLIAPLWSEDKLSSINFIRKYMKDNNLYQSSNFH